MFIFKILLYLLMAAFVVAIVGFGWMAMLIITRVWPQMRKEDYLMRNGYYCENGYWCKGDRSLSGSLVYTMSYWRLVDYVEKAKEIYAMNDKEEKL